jgi:cardiolipin synthase
MSIYVSLALVHEIPFWLTLLVISRDILIIGGVIVSWLIDNPLDMRPHMVSKINTTLQILFAAVILASLSFNLPFEAIVKMMVYAVAFTTILSTIVYLAQWTKHVS